ncbi:MAG: sporulation protein YabP [Clostridia bacterium]|nr:sporulation protein YabP [Clostridia bacterium]
MSENSLKLNQNNFKCHNIVLENRRKLCISGVEKVDNVSPMHFSCVVVGTEMHVEGKEMEVTKLDVEQGVVEIAGEINSIQYLGEKKSLLKRIFK